jgi:hypothetical protein
MGGIVLADGTDFGGGNQLVTLNYINTSNQNNDTRTFTGYNTNPATFGAQTSTPQGRIFVRLVYLGANTWRSDLSTDGVSWLKGGTGIKAFVPTHVGVHCSSWGTAVKSTVKYEFFRRMSGVT